MNRRLRWPLFVLLACVRAAAAGPCLEGAATLSDQRALAVLQESLELSCPCASFDGTPGADPMAYRFCAQGIVDGALAGATLRSECKRTSKRLYKDAACGTDRTTCGQYRSTSANKPVTCRVRPAASCADSASTRRTPCAGADFCRDVVDWTAGTCFDPRDRSGPVGVRVLTLVKPSVADPMQPRTLDVVVWYPTAGAGSEDPHYDAVLNAPLDTSGGPRPLLLFSHGACGSTTATNYLLPLLASHGYVVAAVPHPGNTTAEYPTCLTSASLVASAIERPADVTFSLDALLAENATGGSPFEGAIDPARIGMSGHSFGGWTTYMVVGDDARFKVAVLMAGAVPATMPSLSVPSLHMVGALDSVGTTTNAVRRAAFEAAASPKFFVTLLNTGHFAFSDGCLPGYPADCNPPITLTQDEAHVLVDRWVLPFLERYLAGNVSMGPFLRTPVPPGMTLDAQP